MGRITRREFIKAGTGGALGLAGCATIQGLRRDTAHGKRPNLLFVMGDQWRRQAMGFMHEDPVLTPCIDRFVERALAFTNAVSCSPVCAPYRASMLTGRYPVSHKVYWNGIRLPAEEITIAEVLKDAEYDTGYIGKWHLDGGTPSHFIPPGPRRQGFDFWYAHEVFHQHFKLEYYADSPEPIKGDGWQPDHETDDAINYIRTHGKDKPFVLFVSWSPPHTNHGGPRFDPNGERYQYHAPERFEALYRGKNLPRRPNVPYSEKEKALLGTYALPGYFGAITSLDENFGRLLKCLDEQGIAEDTIVVLTSDHGDVMGSQNGFTKGVPYEESIGIPFLIRYPGHVKTRREDLLFNTVDVMPSLLGLMGIPIPTVVEGTDYSAAMCGKKVKEPDSMLLEHFRDNPETGWRALRTRQYTFVVRRTDEGRRYYVLFDNLNDPYQMKPRTASEGEDPLMNKLWDELKRWLEKTNDPWVRSEKKR